LAVTLQQLTALESSSPERNPSGNPERLRLYPNIHKIDAQNETALHNRNATARHKEIKKTHLLQNLLLSSA